MAEFVEVAKLDKVPPGKGTTVTVGEKELALFNVDGTIYATNDGCLHKGSSLGWGGILDGKVVTCRVHGWKYDVTTGSVLSSPEMKLGCYPVKIEQDKVLVEI